MFSSRGRGKSQMVIRHTPHEAQILDKIKAVERMRGGVVPAGHKQRYAAQAYSKTYADIVKICASQRDAHGLGYRVHILIPPPRQTDHDALFFRKSGRKLEDMRDRVG